MTALYRVFDARGDLLYVGISGDWRKRLRQHATVSPWFPMAETLTVDPYPDHHAAELAERDAIRYEWPAWNVNAGNGGCEPAPWAGLANVLRSRARGWRERHQTRALMARCWRLLEDNDLRWVRTGSRGLFAPAVRRGQ